MAFRGERLTNTPDGPGRVAAAGGHRHAGAAVGGSSARDHARARGRGRRRPQVRRPSPTDGGREGAPTPSWWCGGGRSHRPPRAAGGLSARGPAVAIGSGGEGESERRQGAVGELDPPGGLEHRDQVAPGPRSNASSRPGRGRSTRSQRGPPGRPARTRPRGRTNGRRGGRRTGTGCGGRRGGRRGCACRTRVSPGMSRRLLTTSSAVARKPDRHRRDQRRAPAAPRAARNDEPAVATTPKKVNTKTSPRPR